MKTVLIITISHKARDVRLFHKIAKTLATKYKVIILHNEANIISTSDNIELIGLDKQSKKVFLSSAIAYIAQLHPDVVMVVEPILLILSNIFIKTKFVYDCHEFFGLAQREKSDSKFKQYIDEQIHSNLERKTIPRLHACITVNDILTNHYKTFGTDSYTIPNYPIIKDSDIVNRPVKYDFIYIGGLSPVRGITKLIQATKVVKIEFPNVKVIIIGKEQITGYFTECENLIKELDLQENIIIKYEISYDRVPDYLAKSRCGLCMLSPDTTRYKYALPIKLLEYLDAGLVVITNDFPFNKKIYNSSEAILTTKFKVGAIATEMIKSIGFTSDKINLHKQKMKSLIKNSYSWQLQEDKLLNIFDKLTNNINRGFLIAYFFPPLGGAGVQRPLKFTKYSKELGWDFDVLTVKDIMFHSYDESFLKEIDNTIIRADSFDLMSLANKLKLFKPAATNDGEELSNTYFKTSEFKKKLVKSLFFLDDKIGWFIPALYKAMQNFIKKDYKVIVVTIYPVSSLLIGWALSKIFKKPLIIDYRDHWTLSSYFDFSNDFSRNQYAKLEKFFLDECSGVLTIGKIMKQELVEKFNIPENKVEVMYNGFDDNDFKLNKFPTNKKLTISYIGNMYKHRTSKYFLQAINELITENKIERDKICLKFMGNYYIEELDNFKDSQLDDIIQVIPQQEHELAIEEMQQSDILLLLIGSKSGKNVLTGKVFEYLRCNKPILGLVPAGGEAEQLLHDVGNKWTAPAEDVIKIKEQILDIIEHSSRNNEVNWNIRGYSRLEQTKKAIEFIDSKL